MARAAKDGLSKHPKHGFRLTVGKKSDGKPRLFWLGRERGLAEWAAQGYRDRFKKMKAEGREVWTDDDIAIVKRVVAYFARQRQRDIEELSEAREALTEAAEAVDAQSQELEHLWGDTSTGGNVVDNSNSTEPTPPAVEQVTIATIESKYIAHAATYYRYPDGTPTDEIKSIKLAMGPLKAIHAATPVKEFGPLAMAAVREDMIGRGWSRSYVNQACGRIKRLFKWAVSQELVPASVFHALQTVTGLRRGRSAAKDADPIKPVPDAHVEAVRSRVSAEVKAMIDTQLLTGMRPGEVCNMRTCDIDRSENPWGYRPEHHKAEHHGHERVIYIGPKAQVVLQPFLNVQEPDAYLFSPADAEKARRAKMSKARKTPLSCGNRPGTNKSKNPKRPPGDKYDIGAYRRSIARACRAADAAAHKKDATIKEDVVVVPAWHPHQLRHNAATRLRKEYGLEAAQVILGHRTLTATQIYAEKNAEAGKTIMASVG